MTPDIADIIAGELKVSRGTAYDMMREALKEASPVQEPVERPCHVFNVTKTGASTEWEPTTMAFALTDGKHALYTAAQKPWVGLSEKEVEAYDSWADFQVGCGRQTLFDMVRDIEAKLKEKNHV
jgi:hypothetical protein